MADVYDPEKITDPIRTGFASWYGGRAELDAMARRDDHWDDLAERLARDAFEAHFPLRWGTWYLAHFDKLAYFNNNPYAADPFRRDREHFAIRGRLEGLGIRELGCGFWPPPTSGPPRPSTPPRPEGWDGPWPPPGVNLPRDPSRYTYAVVVDAPLRDLDTVWGIQDEAFMMDLD